LRWDDPQVLLIDYDKQIKGVLWVDVLIFVRGSDATLKVVVITGPIPPSRFDLYSLELLVLVDHEVYP
jgi:hypothetical protein